MPATPLLRIAGAIADLVRWAEPWDVEDDEDPLLDRCGASDPFGVWA